MTQPTPIEENKYDASKENPPEEAERIRREADYEEKFIESWKTGDLSAECYQVNVIKRTSKCCKANVREIGEDGMLNYICLHCEKSCDIDIS